MTSVLEIAARAEVPAEQVLRVLNGEPVSDLTARKVQEAVAALEMQPPASSALAERAHGQAPTPVNGTIVEAPGHDVAGEFGSLVYEAVRVEVRPVAERVGAIDALFREVLSGLNRVAAEVAADRRDRVDDLALQVELIRASWTSVDRRLGRLERMIERQANGEARREPEVLRVEPQRRPSTTRFGRRPDADASGPGVER